ncbi:hypothetical protein [Flagellimonas aequoris]|uniref:SGNH/GDSL hydrolase family protein n=1 Tax=Flagellimonas aequoris TaxID=2306997 RepID=A0ABY3KWA0_9FLAO|nr:hypothetical protein [Allomuricauda aequoris]TXK05064.1 hypothetical protein FQ019_04800 [Allomuricauda aequoris]
MNRFGVLLNEYDDVQQRWEYFYNLPENSLEVLILGNSHAYSTYSPDVIDAVCGIDSYLLAGNSQKMEQTYYNLKEALKYQSPRVVVIQATVLSGDSWKTETGDYRVYSNLMGMKFSWNKLKAISAQRPSEDYVGTLFPLLRNHNNWKRTELIGENLAREESGKKDDYRGFSPRVSEMTPKVMRQFDNAKKTDYSSFELGRLDLHYMGEIKKLSLKKGFKVIYAMSPKYPDIINPTYLSKHKVLEKEISNLGHEYIDYNMLADSIGLLPRSFENGFIEYQHTSYYGAVQVSKHLAQHLKDKNLIHKGHEGKDKEWIARMGTKPEYIIFNESRPKTSKTTLYSSEVDFKFLDSIVVDKLDIIKKQNGVYEVILQFKKNLDVEKLMQHKFYVHLYPDKKDTNIRDDRKEFGYENFDFIPVVLPRTRQNYYIIREIETEIVDVAKIDFGLFKSGSRSERLTLENIKLTKETD